MAGSDTTGTIRSRPAVRANASDALWIVFENVLTRTNAAGASGGTAPAAGSIVIVKYDCQGGSGDTGWEPVTTG